MDEYTSFQIVAKAKEERKRSKTIILIVISQSTAITKDMCNIDIKHHYTEIQKLKNAI